MKTISGKTNALYRRDDFMIQEDCCFLNHGSFGSIPKVVFDEQIRYIKLMESQTFAFYTDLLHGFYFKNLNRLSKFLNCSSDDLVFISNATYGTNCAANSIDFKKGDEIIMTDNEYPSMDVMWEYYAKNKGLVLKKVKIPKPIESYDQIVEAFKKEINDRTKVIFFSHIISTIACIMPAKELVDLAKEHNLISIIDGAHAPAHVDLDLSDLDPDYYVGNLHKWLNTPKGCAFFYVKKELKDSVVPVILSMGIDMDYPLCNKFQSRFYWPGTVDQTPFLCVDKALEYIENIGIKEYQNYGHEIVKYGLEEILKLSNLTPFYKPESEFYGMMATCPFNYQGTREEFREKLLKDNIEVVSWETSGNNPQKFIRISGHLHTNLNDIDKLIGILKKYA